MKYLQIDKKLTSVVIYLLILLTPTFSYAQAQIGCDTSAADPILLSGGLPKGFDSTKLNIESIELPFPSLIWAYDSDEVYVFGGQPLGLDLYVNAIMTGDPGNPNPAYYNQFFPYVVKIDPTSMDTMFLNLSGGSGVPYLGGVAKHKNGYLYAVAQARIFKIDPTNMSVVQYVDMPTPDQQTIYNGVNVLRDGKLITKSTTLNGFTSGKFIMLDPDSLQTITELDVDAGSARVTLGCDSLGNEYIYHLNKDYTFRINISSDSLFVDSTWLAVWDPYGNGLNDPEPTSPRLYRNRVVYTTNTGYSATTPMKIFWQNTDQCYSVDRDTLGGFFMFSDTLSPQFDFMGLTIDAATGIIIGQDQATGKIAAYEINQNDQLQYLWEQNYGISSRPAIAENSGLVYLNDFNASEGSDYLVILDLFTGQEMGRIKTPGTTASVAINAIGAQNDFYYCSNEVGQPMGYFHRVYLDNTTNLSETITNESINVSNYPNPFSNTTTIQFELTQPAKVNIDLFNALGARVEVLTEQNYISGIHEITFDGSDYENGLYFYRVHANGNYVSKSMVIHH